MNLKNNDNKYIISAKALNDNVSADGVSTIEVEFTFTDTATYDPAKALPVVIELEDTKTAVIKANNSMIYKTVTDGSGKVTVSITDTVDESVVVTAFVLASQSDNSQVTITFLPTGDVFGITSVTNANKTFTTGEPTVAWKGASFTIHTKGGSGPIVWTTSGATQEIVVEGDETERTAGVTILAMPQQSTIIKATDTYTNESDEIVIDIKTFVEPHTTKKSLPAIILTYKNALLAPDDYATIYKEWGNMGSYESQGWKVDDVYWTSEYGAITGIAYDLSSGTEKVDFDNITVKHYFCIETGKV